MKRRWIDILISFFFAFTLWFTLSGTGKSVLPFEVRLEYRNLPQELVIKEGLVNTISVRVSASAGLISSMSGRTYAYTVDLGALVKGENVLQISKDRLPFPGAADILTVEPAQLRIIADTIETKTVPLVLMLQGALPTDYAVKGELQTTEVQIRGSSSLLKNIDHLPLNIELVPPFNLGTSKVTRTLPVPDGISVTPPQVNITLLTDLKRKRVSVTRSVVVPTMDGISSFTRPTKVQITAEIPESLAAKASASQEITAFIELKQRALGTESVPVKTTLPDGARLIKIEPAHVNVTLEQPPPARPKK